MSPEPLAELHGIIPPVVTPLTRERRLDRESAVRLYQYMLDAGAHGLFLFGSSGEGPLLSDADRQAALQTAAEVVGGKTPLLAGVMAPGTDAVIEQARRAQQLGATALVVCVPFYFPPSQAEILAHFRSVREAVELPLIAYDIPVTTKVKIQLRTMLQLAREGTISGVKDSSGDAVGFRQLLVQRPPGFKMFTGAELLVDGTLLAGADGCVPGLANVAPAQLVQLYNQWRSGDYAAAVQTQTLIARLFEVFLSPDGTIQVGHVIPVMKAALCLRGVIAQTTCCRPFADPSPELIARTKALMEETGVL